MVQLSLRKIMLVVCLAIVIGGAGCTSRSGGVSPRVSNTPQLVVEKIDNKAVAALGTIALTPVVLSSEVEASDALSFNRQMSNLAQQAEGFTYLSLTGPVDVVGGFRPLTLKASIERARAAGAGGVLEIRVLKYIKRRGSSAGADIGAQVYLAFSLHQIDGTEIWAGSYLVKDQAVSDNLLKLADKHDGKGWHTAADLFSQGVEGCFVELAKIKREALRFEPNNRRY